MIVYPNPVRDYLQVSYESASEESRSVKIINVQGAVVFLQIQKSRTGTNHGNIPVLTLQKGICLNKILRGNKIEIGKFINN